MHTPMNCVAQMQYSDKWKYARQLHPEAIFFLLRWICRHGVPLEVLFICGFSLKEGSQRMFFRSQGEN